MFVWLVLWHINHCSLFNAKSICCIVTIQLYKYKDAGKYETLATLRCSGTKRLLTSWLFRHEERKTQFLLCWLYYLTNKLAAHPVAPKITIGRDLQKSMVRLQLHLSASMADKPTVPSIVHSKPPIWTGPAQSRISTTFSKSPNSQPIASGHDVIHTPDAFPIWGFYDEICDCHILCARAWIVLIVCAPALRAE